jgi:hypothetical protein
VLAIVGVFAVDTWQNKSQRKKDHWPRVVGKASASRVVEKPPTENFHTTMYVGQCSVEYMVEGKTNSLWAGSGYLDPGAEENTMKATPEEIKQHDEEYRLRLKYWHVLVFVDGMRDGEATECAHRDDMEVIHKRLEPYDLSSMCDLTTTPKHNCICSGAGIRLR